MYRFNKRRLRHFYWHWRQYPIPYQKIYSSLALAAQCLKYSLKTGPSKYPLLYQPHKFLTHQWPQVWVAPERSFKYETPYLAYARPHVIGPHSPLPVKYVIKAGVLGLGYRLAVYGQIVILHLLLLTRPCYLAARHIIKTFGVWSGRKLTAAASHSLIKALEPSDPRASLAQGVTVFDVPFFYGLALHKRFKTRLRRRRRLRRWAWKGLRFLCKFLVASGLLSVLL